MYWPHCLHDVEMAAGASDCGWPQRGQVTRTLACFLAGIQGVLKNGSVGDSPAPVGDSPNGTTVTTLRNDRSLRLDMFSPIPSGESPNGTGGPPVLPNAIFSSTFGWQRLSVRPFWQALGFWGPRLAAAAVPWARPCSDSPRSCRQTSPLPRWSASRIECHRTIRSSLSCHFSLSR